MRVSAIGLCAASLVCLSVSAASAQDTSAGMKSDREAARALAEQGFDLYEQGDAASAIASFRMAEQRVHSLVHQLYIARAEVKLGMLVEALRTYEGIVAEKLASDSPKPFLDAQADARKELDALRPRVPSIKISVRGASSAEAQVRIDGALIEPGLLGRPIPVNPGVHTLRATLDGESVEEIISVAEGAVVNSVELALHAPVSVPAVVAFSLGSVGLVVGTATGIAYLGASDSNPTLGVISLAGLITGGVGLATGTLVVALRSPGSASASTASQPRFHASIGPGSISVCGSF